MRLAERVNTEVVWHLYMTAPIRLETRTGHLFLDLQHDPLEETREKVVLRGQRGQVHYKVIIPSTQSGLTPAAATEGIRHIGMLYAGPKGVMELRHMLVHRTLESEVQEVASEVTRVRKLLEARVKELEARLDPVDKVTYMSYV